MVIQSGNVQMQSNHKLAKTYGHSFKHKKSMIDVAVGTNGETTKSTLAQTGLQEMTTRTGPTADSANNAIANDLFETTLTYSVDKMRLGASSEKRADTVAETANGENKTSDVSNLSGTGSAAKNANSVVSTKSPLEQLLEGKSHEQRMQTLGYLLLQILYGHAGGNYAYNLNDAAQDVLDAQGVLDAQRYSHSYILDEYTSTEFYQEEESYTFETTGMVQTADGREISFGVTVGMSRSFYQENTTFVQRLRSNTLDPLVLNVDADVTSVSDQKFYFDLNGDGDEEYISKLAAGCGFLALDKNSDGKVNDGTELFGPNLGNGFEELALFDLDGNGWIDEADPIYSQLKIWEFDEAGEATLYSLKEKNVGTICLQRTETAFSLNEALTNTTNGYIRETGVFLTESGMAGTVQHLDFAI